MLLKEKYLSIFNYLYDFVKIRDKTVFDITSEETKYPEKLWFSEIPNNDIFNCIAFPEFDRASEYILLADKPRDEPKYPDFKKLSETLKSNEELKEWIEIPTHIDENSIPILKESLGENIDKIQLANFSHIQDQFDEYIQENWSDDVSIFKENLAIYKSDLAVYTEKARIYKQLFTIYNKLQQFPDQLELIIGVGLLNYSADKAKLNPGPFKKKEDGHQNIYRHILAVKAEISIEARSARIKLNIGNGSEIQIEDNLLYNLPDFTDDDIIGARKELEEFINSNGIDNDIFDPKLSNEGFQIFTDKLAPDTEFNEGISKPIRTDNKHPKFYFSPAILLRQKTLAASTEMFKSIIDIISKEPDDIKAPLLNPLVGAGKEDIDIDYPFRDNRKNFIYKNQDDVIYFPKPSNEEQYSIIDAVKRSDSVLVQGPPGTGKSHTIANLISHLLATGNNILVTAKTQTALKVLKFQLPKDFQGLVVNSFGSDSDSLQDLEKSVLSINAALNKTTNLESKQNEIQKLFSEFISIKSQQLDTEKELIKLKEDSIADFEINSYQGTLGEIAKDLNKEASHFSWFKDNFSKVELSDKVYSDLKLYVTETEIFDKENIEELSLGVPEKDKILEESTFIHFKNLNDFSIDDSHQDHINFKIEDYKQLTELLEDIKISLEKIRDNGSKLKEDLLNELPSNFDLWDDKISSSSRDLDKLSKINLIDLDTDYDATYPKDKSWKELRTAATQLLNYLKEKGKKQFGGRLFSLTKWGIPDETREKLFFIEEVKLNGSAVDTPEEFEIVLEDIEARLRLENLNDIWKINSQSNKKKDSFKFYDRIHKQTKELLECRKDLEESKKPFERFPKLKFNPSETDIDTIQQMIDEVNYKKSLERKERIEDELKKVSRYLSENDLHPIAKDIQEAIDSRDLEKYKNTLLKIDRINDLKERHKSFKILEKGLKNRVPTLIDEIIEGKLDKKNIEKFQKAVIHKNTRKEIEERLSLSPKYLEYRLEELDERIKDITEQMGSQKAWLKVLKIAKKNPKLSSDLTAWSQAVRRIGRGKGKKANRYRKEAQNHMDSVKDLIPCWVMPLYNIMETVKPKLGMYDYVIIDEASQLGPEAIFLLFIAKKIIIVGDDKQTAPSDAFMDDNQLQSQIKKHLNNIPYSLFYGPDSSFFDHALRFCSDKVILREHFRCMPEIIEFSNKHFYKPSGMALYPLKQYSQKRLDPIKSVYCPNAISMPRSKINEIEAEYIANQIADITKKSSYEGKTIGVISLIGRQQADLIDQYILNRIDQTVYRERKIVCGDPSSFQGDERDIIFLSLVRAPNPKNDKKYATFSALTTDKSKRSFNVAVSRAKEQVWLFHSIQLEDISTRKNFQNNLQYQILHYFQNPQKGQETIRVPQDKSGTKTPKPFDSWFEVDVYNDIVSKGYSVIPQYKVGGERYIIDLVVQLNNGTKIAVECDGLHWHSGADAIYNDLIRQRNLERCGWQFFRITDAEYYSDGEKYLNHLWKILESNNSYTEPSPSNNQGREKHTQSIENTIGEELETNYQNPKTDETNRLDGMDFSNESTGKASQDNDKSEEQVYAPKEEVKAVSIKQKENLLKYQEFIVFTLAQNAYKVQNKNLKTKSEIYEKIEFEINEKPHYVTGTNNYSGFMLFAFENGKMAKIPLASYKTEQNRKKLLNVFNGDSKLIFLEHFDNDIDLVAISSIEKIALFNTSCVSQIQSRNAKGIQLMRPAKKGGHLKQIKRLDQVQFANPEYYRKNNTNFIGFLLSPGDRLNLISKQNDNKTNPTAENILIEKKVSQERKQNNDPSSPRVNSNCFVHYKAIGNDSRYTEVIMRVVKSKQDYHKNLQKKGYNKMRYSDDKIVKAMEGLKEGDEFTMFNVKFKITKVKLM